MTSRLFEFYKSKNGTVGYLDVTGRETFQFNSKPKLHSGAEDLVRFEHGNEWYTIDLKTDVVFLFDRQFRKGENKALVAELELVYGALPGNLRK